MQIEKRKNSRLDWGILVHHNHKRMMTGDLSPEGCFIIKDERVKDLTLLPIGSEIDFSFDFLNEDYYIDVTGEVVHHGDNEDGMGIWFRKIDDRTKEFIRMFVRDFL